MKARIRLSAQQLLFPRPISASTPQLLRRLIPAGTCWPSSHFTSSLPRTAAVPDSDKPHFPLQPSANPFPDPRIIPKGPPHSRFCNKRSGSIKPRLPTGSASANHTHANLKSSLAYSSAAVAVAIVVALVSWTIVDFATAANTGTALVSPLDTRPVDVMSPEAAAAGHVGNLTPEQEKKLRKLWNAIFKICGVADINANGTAESAAPAKPAEEELESPQKRRFSLFRWKTSESQPSPPGSSTGSVKDAPDDNDKYGQTKQFHKTLASQSPESIRQTIWSTVKHDHPDALVLRFLRARKWDVEKALVMLVSAMHWRHSDMNVDADIMKNGEAGAVYDEKNGAPDAKKLAIDYMAQYRMGKSFLHGKDKEGRPICVVRVRLHKPGAQSAESLERYTVFIIETARLVLEPPVETANIIFDMTGFSLANMDYHPVKFMIQCFEANYPESLGAILVHNAPWVFQGIWRIIRGWLDPVVAAKVHFTNYRTGLEEFIAPDQIIKELEGDEDWEYKYEEPVPGENDTMKDTETRDALLKARAELYREFEGATRTWIRSPDTVEGKQAKSQREKIAAQLRMDYWNLDPYVRSRSLYDRKGELLPGGGVNWYKKENQEPVPQTNGNGVHSPGTPAENGA
ncbi:CRAL-TRIO domain-containing protein C3H8.02 [Tolypocladium ophioglossoides CBS 100239]|uniref:CRAL-TRIO domain-containing protein C3H8.02 n=1 Tax=Tolypocladium ophioglossoides (strain CBS 100239) TaxID=1163406 RepID=A0A0L0N9P0_TOLOC|nr:CRAL-TRIO domain-containing protein C3H8.02 [Tolypocladium ophioglossoides CBS 100239]